MGDVPEALAALFASRPAAPKKVAPSTEAFFDMMKKAAPAPAPVAPTIRQASRIPQAPGIDIFAAATEALGKTGYFDSGGAPGTDFANARPGFVAPQVSRPITGMFKGIGSAPSGKRGPRPKKALNASATSLASLFGLPEEPVFTKGKIADAVRREGVKDSFELQRILKVPRRPSIIDTAADLTDEFHKASGTMRLWARQSACLAEARRAGGLFGALGAGSGKTLVSLLMGSALSAKQTVILVPPALRSQLLTVDIPRLAKEWQIPLARIRVVAYSQLSSAASADILEEIGPDLIVADEVHLLRYRTAARTKRFLRFMKAHPECRFVALSGTMTRRSLRDFAHLAELALRKNSPLPDHFPTLNEWAEALDVVGNDDPMPPGALLGLCNGAELEEIATLGEAEETEATPHEIQRVVRGAFRRRLIETPGVVATEESAIGTSLTINALRPLVPAEVQTEIMNVRSKWEIQGEELVDALSVARVARQLAAGFFYRPVWPDGIVDREWLDARREWNREIREILRLSKKGLDSPMLIAGAVERGEYHSEAYAKWREVKDRPEPPREAVWINDFLVREAITWAEKNASKAAPALLWYAHTAVGEKLAELSGFPFFGAGMKASELLTKVDVKKTPVIICSQKAHGVGKNLQSFCLNLMTTPIPGGADMEQLIARTHRPGQEADEVQLDVFVHTTETLSAFKSAVRDAEYIEATQGQRQKLLMAQKLGFGEHAFEFGNLNASDIESEGIEWHKPSDLFGR